MRGPFETRLVESTAGLPIVDVGSAVPLCLSAELELEFGYALQELPYPSFGVTLNAGNLSYAPSYGAEEQARLYRREPFLSLEPRLLILVRYRAASLAAMVHAMRADMLNRSPASGGFAPDFETALRLVRRAARRVAVGVP